MVITQIFLITYVGSKKISKNPYLVVIKESNNQPTLAKI
jgi:hypothetical protein